MQPVLLRELSAKCAAGNISRYRVISYWISLCDFSGRLEDCPVGENSRLNATFLRSPAFGKKTLSLYLQRLRRFPAFFAVSSLRPRRRRNAPSSSELRKSVGSRSTRSSAKRSASS